MLWIHLSLKKPILFALALSVCLAASQSTAAPAVIYKFRVDTTSVQGQNADLDLQFNPSSFAGDPLAYLSLQDFRTDGTLFPAVNDGFTGSSGDVSGSLPGTLSFDNGETQNPANLFNDYCENITFGSNITFTVIVTGPALANVTNVADSFVVDFFNATNSNAPYLLAADPTGDSPCGWVCGTIEFETDGTNLDVYAVAGPGLAQNEDPRFDPNSVTPAVIFFSPSNLFLSTEPLNIQSSGANVTITWTNSAFSLYSSTNVTGLYTNLVTARSPYVTAATNQQVYYRLVEP